VAGETSVGTSQTSLGKGPERSRWRGDASLLSPQRLVESPQLFERFLYGLALVDRDRSVLYLNRKARQLLVPAEMWATGRAWTCCELLCNRLGPTVGGGCMTERLAQADGQMPEVRIDIEQDRLHTAAWLTASPLDGDDAQLLFCLRPGRPGDRRRRTPPEWPGHISPSHRSELQIVTLGRFQVEGPNGPINGDWLEQRPGQLLKYLVGERRRVVASDRIAEALWPEAGPEEARNRLRQYVHALREKLEPDRTHRSPARFVVARRGAYCFETSGVWIDADEFEREARAGLAAFDQGFIEPAAAHLTSAMRLYQGDFLAEDPYAEWALDERERLRELAGRALRAQVGIQMQMENLEVAADHARRLADMEPFDTDVQKLFIDLCLKRGRRSEAFRRYSLLRKRLLTSFGQEPDFDLAELESQADQAGVEPEALGEGVSPRTGGTSGPASYGPS
jgi:DNA-binding SARP family transcriptional activator